MVDVLNRRVISDPAIDIFSDDFINAVPMDNRITTTDVRRVWCIYNLITLAYGFGTVNPNIGKI